MKIIFYFFVALIAPLYEWIYDFYHKVRDNMIEYMLHLEFSNSKWKVVSNRYNKVLTIQEIKVNPSFTRLPLPEGFGIRDVLKVMNNYIGNDVAAGLLHPDPYVRDYWKDVENRKKK